MLKNNIKGQKYILITNDVLSDIYVCVKLTLRRVLKKNLLFDKKGNYYSLPILRGVSIKY
jgi:hypothetical protein